MADDDGAGLAGLLAACETITKTPLAPSDDVVAEFFARYPLDVVFRYSKAACMHDVSFATSLCSESKHARRCPHLILGY
jgi:hypothetical protein